jgi:hypothetical protein
MESVEAQVSPGEVDAKVTPPSAADLAVALVCHKNFETIVGVIRAAEQALSRHFPGETGVILLADLGSPDETAAAVRSAVTDPTRLVLLSLPTDAGRTGDRGPVPGSRAIRSLFESAAGFAVKALAVIDPDLAAPDPEAIARLLAPILESGADFVAPYYARPRFAGAITTSIVYPFTRALYGLRLRFPAGGDFGCSTKFTRFCIAQGSWGGDDSRITADLWLVHRALTGGFRLGQAVLGPRARTGADGNAELSDVLARVLGVLFSEAERNVPFWQKVRTSAPVPLIGTPAGTDQEGPPIDLRRTVGAFRLGLEHLMPVWRTVLPPTTLLELMKLARQSEGDFRLTDALWARIVYDFAIAFHRRVMSREHLLSAITPLYFGWLATHVAEMAGADYAGSERRVEELCLRFESEKPYLISRWRWPDRFSP